MTTTLQTTSTLDVFHEPGSVVEVRIIGIPGRGRPHTASGYFNDFALAAEAVAKFEAEHKPEGIYFVLNEADPQLFARSPNTITEFPKHTTADPDITRRRWLLVDIDPKRPAGIGSTDAQLEAARATSEAVREWLAEQFWAEPILAMSGNGYHLLYPIDLPNDEESRLLVVNVLKVLAARFDSEQVSIDQSVFNAARITKFYGTTGRKGHETESTPHRQSKLVYVPDYLEPGATAEREVVSLERLQTVAAMAPQQDQSATSTSQTPYQQTNGNGNRRLDVPRWLQSKGLMFRVKDRPTDDGRTVYVLDECPINREHGGNGEVCVMQAESGKLSASCKHSSCQGNGWQQFKQAIGEPGPADYDGYSGSVPPETWQQPEQRWEPLDGGVEPAKPITIGELIDAHPRMRSPVIDGLLRRGETANIIADPKRGKSWLAYGLALSICTERAWLDTFATTRGKVLLVDNELHPETIAHRFPVVANTMGIRLEEYHDRLDVLYLRGRLVDFVGIGEIVRRIEAGEYAAMIVDAYYRALPRGTSENDNSQIAGIYNLIDSYAEHMDGAVLLIHHSTKGSQAEKRTTDVGVGAGSQSRAADTHLVLREHEEPGFVVLDAAVRSFPPVDSMVLQWCFPVWMPREDMDTDKLKGRLSKGKERQQDRDHAGMRDIIDVLRNWNTEVDGIATPNQITDKSPFGKERTRNLFAKLFHTNEVTRQLITIRGNKTHEYKLADDAKS